MATHLPTVNIYSSPPSGGTRTHHGTPSTIPTIMSPEARNDRYDSGTGIPKLELASNSTLANRRNLSVAHVAIPTRLSPTAEDFTPSADTTTFPASVTNPRPVKHGSTLRNVGVIGQGPTNFSHAVQQLPLYRFGTFTTEDDTTRTFVVSGVRGSATTSLYEYVAVSYKNFKSVANINAKGLSNGIFSVEFYDHEEAKQALCLTIDFIFHNQPLHILRLLPKDTAIHNEQPVVGLSNHAGEYIVSIVNVGARVSRVTGDDVFQACQTCGKVKAFHTYPTIAGAMMSFRVEWNDIRANATSLSMAVFSGYRITIMSYTPDVTRSLPVSNLGHPSPVFDSDEHTRNIMAFLQPEPSSRVNVSATHNVVDIMKIMLGQDVRTTIMLRNIPNRVDQANLKKLLDETSFGQYDFMYLRIDFANNCNVGYAFINFVDPMAIVPFAKARAGQKWNLFQSDKVAEISYATIQGRDCLVQKFRNSSVMLEQPAFRPKLYRTGKGPDAGEEEDFPEADNHAKLKRSCDNAEHVGLYRPDSPPLGSTCLPISGPVHIPAPRNQKAGGRYIKPASDRTAITISKALALLELEESVQHGDFPAKLSSSESSPTSLYAPREGQAYRERQRRQFSQFDRGTPGAESELTTFPGRVSSAALQKFNDPSYGTIPSDAAYRSSGLGFVDGGVSCLSRRPPTVQQAVANLPYTISEYVGRSLQRVHI